MRKLLVIGIGAGDPDHMTLQAIAALERTDVFMVPDKGETKAALRDARLRVCERFLAGKTYRVSTIAMPTRDRADRDYKAVVGEWHTEIAARYRESLLRDVGEDETGAILVWGDPGLYDSTIRIVDSIQADGLTLDIEVIPGISSVQALAARHRIPLNRIGEPVLITTGRRLAAGLPDSGTAVVMLDGEQTFERLDEDLVIHWGAYLGTKDEILIAGRLGDVGQAISRARAEARAAHGWIMDIYMLHRP